MALDSTVAALVGEPAVALQVAPSNERKVLVPTQIGDGLAGPRNVQQLQIFRDALPIPADELAFQRSLGMEVIARHRAGRYFFLNPDMTANQGGLSSELPGMPNETKHFRPFRWNQGQLASGHKGTKPVSVLPHARTVYYTATPWVGYGLPTDSGTW